MSDSPKPILHAVYISDAERSLRHGQIFCLPGQPHLTDKTGDHPHKSIALRCGEPVPKGLGDIVDLDDAPVGVKRPNKTRRRNR